MQQLLYIILQSKKGLYRDDIHHDIGRNVYFPKKSDREESRAVCWFRYHE